MLEGNLRTLGEGGDSKGWERGIWDNRTLTVLLPHQSQPRRRPFGCQKWQNCEMAVVLAKEEGSNSLGGLLAEDGYLCHT